MALPQSPITPSSSAGRPHFAWFAAGLLCASVAFVAYLVLASTSPGIHVTTPARPTPAPLMVQVVGAVQHPGVVPLPATGRVQDAVTAAGGLAANADASRLNLAAHVTDGQRLVIPSTSDGSGGSIDTLGVPTLVIASSGSTGAATAGPAGTIRAGSSAVRKATPVVGQNGVVVRVNLNTATALELESLPGIGATTAQKIVAYRDKTPFTSVQDLLSAKLVNSSTYTRVQDLVTVD